MGYVFVEIIPTRVVAQAYVFRMVTVFVWLGWILIAQSISVSLMRGKVESRDSIHGERVDPGDDYRFTSSPHLRRRGSACL